MLASITFSLKLLHPTLLFPAGLGTLPHPKSQCFTATFAAIDAVAVDTAGAVMTAAAAAAVLAADPSLYYIAATVHAAPAQTSCRSNQC